MGRPSIYSDELAAEICDRLANGETLSRICRSPHMPDRHTILDWAIKDRAGFSLRYARARDLQLEFWADDLVEISDDARNDWMERNGEVQFNNENVQRSRLRADTRKWLLSKLWPDKYGERVENRTTINLADPIAALLKQIAEQGVKIYDPRPE